MPPGLTLLEVLAERDDFPRRLPHLSPRRTKVGATRNAVYDSRLHSPTTLPDYRPTMSVKDCRDHDRVQKHPVEDGVGREGKYAASPNVPMHLREPHGGFGDHLEDSANLEQEADRDAGVDRVLPVPISRIVDISRCGSADPVLQADRRRPLCLARRRAMTTSPSSSVPASSRSRRSSSSAIHLGTGPS